MTFSASFFRERNKLACTITPQRQAILRSRPAVGAEHSAKKVLQGTTQVPCS
ncbi:hypothetical protein BRCON_2834 [Candidatus Sumerlaea chitinivorans]|uniref:Uncharacterized protein n=1 Tax=Sumerlaea chitinivorans TaxID=2250252 RepID=A0A2Z4Y952_SUMC1|nr:hypothetical protein BRCON_2834 [Candidatus Sumerlaea chitinivorans]